MIRKLNDFRANTIEAQIGTTQIGLIVLRRLSQFWINPNH